MLGELATTNAARVTEYKARKTRYDQRTFRRDEAEFASSEGWELVRENQNSDRYQRLKPHYEQLENEFWCLLYNFGYASLNVGRKFQIEVTSNKRVTVSKQVDVFGYDQETIIVAECKSCEKRTRRQLQKDLGDFIANQKPVANTLRRFLGAGFKQKIIWFFVTRNIEWSQPDLARADEANIKVITEKDLFYYKEIAKRIGRAARHQFHAEFLANTKVHALERKVFAMRTKLGAHKAYTFFASAETILPIAFVNHRDLRDPNAAPSYQRLIHRPRLKDIAAYLANGGFFPNAIILNFKKKIRFDLLKPEDEFGITPGEMTLPDTYKSAWIIDGQHRLYGYTELGEDERGAHLPFLAFENISIAEETRIFADINSKQKSVSKKLLDEITGEIKLDSANKREQLRAIASRAFDLMRDDEDGPFGDKVAGAEIKRGDGSILTIPYLVDATIQSGVLGRIVTTSGSTTYVQGPLLWDDPREAITSLSELFTEYFDLFRSANAHRWNSAKAGKFATNVGVAALIRLLGDVIAFMASKDHEDPRELHPKVIVERIEQYLQPSLQYFTKVGDDALEQRFTVPFGAGGQRVFQHRLREILHEKFPSFNPPGFEEDLRKYDATRRQEADRKVRDVVEAVHRFVIKRLREVYGNQDNYLSLAVENKTILTRAFEKQVEADPEKQKDLATYLDFIDLRKIVETPKNWGHFKEDLDIALPDEHPGRKHTRWFDDINKLRRVSAHPYNRGYDDAEVDEIQLIHQTLVTRHLILV
jgi:DNA sulfur modification protein DndB